MDGFEVGDKVKWNHENTVQSGTVQQVVNESCELEINGDMQEVKVNEETLVYVVEGSDGQQLILEHRDLILQDTDDN